MFTHLTDTRGAAMVEYALLLALIAVVAIGALEALGTSVNQIFGFLDGEVAGAVPAVTP